MSTGLEVDYIDGERVRDGSRQFHVHWKGFPDTAASWESRSNLQWDAKVDEHIRRHREQQGREQADERRRKPEQQQSHERWRGLFSGRAPAAPAATGRRIRIAVKRDDRLPIIAQRETDPIDFPRRNLAETRFSSERDYDELFQGMGPCRVPTAITGRRGAADGESEYEVRLGGSKAKPMWIAHDVAVKLCPSLVARYLLGTVAAKLGLVGSEDESVASDKRS